MKETSTLVNQASLILNFFIKALANQALGFIQNISMITHMFILSLNYPVRVQNFFAGLFPMVTFDLFPTDDIYEEIFGFSELDYNEEGLTEQF